MKILGKKFDDKKVKKIVYTAVFGALVFWFVFRFVMIALESKMDVFNPEREKNANGLLVETVIVAEKSGNINVPIAVNKNRAYVSGIKKAKLRAGQSSGDGKIVSVSESLDLDTGMYVVKTDGVADGVNNVLVPFDCYWVPVYAVQNGHVMVVNDSVAESRDVSVIAQDSENACIRDGLSDGDIVVLSRVDEGQKLKIQK